MNEQIAQIIRELLELDPSLQGQEESMKKTIEKLLSEKPETGFDEAYKAELKVELLKQFSKKRSSSKSTRMVYWGLAAMLAIGVLAMSVWFSSDKKINTAPISLQDISAASQKSEMQEMVPLEKPMTEERTESGRTQALPPSPSVMRKDKGAETVSRDSEVEGVENAVEGAAVGGVEGGVLGGVLGTAMGVNEERKAIAPASKADWYREAEAKREEFNTEGYAAVHENDFLLAVDNPLSTFSIDVDTASYANVRRFLMQNRLPPVDAVRIEELINYFDYDYELPKGETPFAVHREVCSAPWNPEHSLVMLALQGQDIRETELPPANLVFLLDVSGSMNEPSKLPLLRESCKLLVRQLSKRDRVAIVVYAGAAGLVLPSTSAADKETIMDALDRLQAGGSTAGGAGINLAYQVAVDNFIKGGNNRVILATDGDFNVGASSDAEMERLIEEKRGQGVFLSVLGFGMGNYKDSKMETLADKGNGNYAYIDSLIEAQKVLANDMRKTLFTIAKDVKIQVEFNPSKVGSYRLIGYENRLLKKEDFRDDRKDAGEVGSGHCVTVFYEIIPAALDKKDPEQLKYMDSRIKDSARSSEELLTVRVRYKKPDLETSVEMVETLDDTDRTIAQVSQSMRFASAVAEFGMLLRDSQYKGQASFEKLIERAQSSIGKDPYGYRQEFVHLAEMAKILIGNR